MNKPKEAKKISDIRSMLETVGNTSRKLLEEIAIKWTKSLINIGDELFINPKEMSTYLKKLRFPDAIVAAAMQQAWFPEEVVEAPKEQE